MNVPYVRVISPHRMWRSESSHSPSFTYAFFAPLPGLAGRADFGLDIRWQRGISDLLDEVSNFLPFPPGHTQSTTTN